MDMECNSITKLVLPAIRINMAEQFSSKYNLNQKEIAHKLGIAQVAVSKYLNGKYSESLKKAKESVWTMGFVDSTVMEMAMKGSPKVIDGLVNELCTRISIDSLVNL
ncbi:MAG: helix-turn-helix domain-containing protein [Candidatus Micrarchaeaceae archaeon]